MAQIEKAAKEKKEKEEHEKKMRHEMRDRLLASGVPENQIEAILDGKRVMPPGMQHNMPPGGFGHGPHPMAGPMHGHHPHHPPPPPMHPQPMHPQPMTGLEITKTKTTYTRMARKHLSIEALRAKAIEWEVDSVGVSVHLHLHLTTIPFPPVAPAFQNTY